MHEWALAESVVCSVLEFSKKEKLTLVSEINVLLGEMQVIDREAFTFAFREITKRNPVIRNAKLNMKPEKTRLECERCGKKWTFSLEDRLTGNERESVHFLPEISHSYMKCPRCGSRDFSIKKGRGVRIKSIKGE